MFSDDPPALVYPDTPEARTDCRVHDPDDSCIKGFCPHFVVDTFALPHPANYRVRCANRQAEGDRTKSWCHRCFVGFIALSDEERNTYERLGHRVEAHHL
jgi:hypothetical protein